MVQHQDSSSYRNPIMVAIVCYVPSEQTDETGRSMHLRPPSAPKSDIQLKLNCWRFIFFTEFSLYKELWHLRLYCGFLQYFTQDRAQRVKEYPWNARETESTHGWNSFFGAEAIQMLYIYTHIFWSCDRCTSHTRTTLLSSNCHVSTLMSHEFNYSNNIWRWRLKPCQWCHSKGVYSLVCFHSITLGAPCEQKRRARTPARNQHGTHAANQRAANLTWWHGHYLIE
jgi:hypothetical protein